MQQLTFNHTSGKLVKVETLSHDNLSVSRRLLIRDAANHAIFQKGSSFVAYDIRLAPAVSEPAVYKPIERKEIVKQEGYTVQERFPSNKMEGDTSEYTDEKSRTRTAYMKLLQLQGMPPTLNMAKAIDMSGRTVAHAFSITKSMMGMLWAHYVYNRENDPRLATLHDDLLGKNGPEKENIRRYLNANRPVTSSLPTLLDVPLRKFFTQSTGLHTSDFSLFQAITLVLLVSKVGEHGKTPGGAKMQDFNSFLHDNWEDMPLENCFNYDNLLTQVASFALKDYMARLTQNPDFLVKNEVVRIFFPPSFTDEHHGHIQEWPVVSAGYTYYYRNGEVGGQVTNTLTLAGLKMTGLDFVVLGRHLLTHHSELLIKIHDDADFYTVIPDDEEELKKGKAGKTGWRYSFFCWIPMFSDEATEKRKWIVFIGHEGQFMLFELISKSLFVRQHFAFTTSAGQNIDFVNLSGHGLEGIKYTSFVYDCKVLLDELESLTSK